MISVIMSTHNRSNTLKRAIDSILNQTYTDYEFIICNDNSSDNTNEILAYYESEYNNIKVITNEINLGLQKSLNKCIKESSGQYIARMDDDDYSYPNRFEEELSFMEKNNLDFVGSNIDFYSEKNGKYGYKEYIEFPSKKDLLTECCFAHPTMIIKSSVLIENNGYSEEKKHIRVEDYELWFRLYRNGFNGGNIQEKLLLYTKNEESVKKIRRIDRINSYKLKKMYFFEYKMPIRLYYIVLQPLFKLLVPYKLRLIINNMKYSNEGGKK